MLMQPRADRSPLSALLVWGGALSVAVALLAVTGYTSRDPDSTVYAGIAARISTEPLGRWIAPEWWGIWDNEGLFREHPVGIFLLPAMLARAGYPAVQASYAVNAAYQVVTLALIPLVAAAFATRRESRALAWALQLILIAFVFRIRANQEYAVLAGVMVALYATEWSLRRASWGWLTAAAFAWVLLVKGVFGLMVPALCALWIAARQHGDSVRRPGPWLTLAATLLVAPVLAGSYELLYRAASGESFLAFYTGPRMDPDAVAEGSLARWPYNVLWYSGRLIWYALPWSVFALGALAAWVHHLRGGVSRLIVGTMSRESVAGLLFATVSSLLLIAGFALSDRKADRFIFPAYFIVGAVGAVTAFRCSPRLSRLVDLLDRPWVPAAFWLALFLLRLASGAHLPRLTFWRS